MSTPPISRRRFLRIGCGVAAAAGLTVCGASLVVPGPPELELELESLTYGGNAMNCRVLVAYATHAGTTMEVAGIIGQVLGQVLGEVFGESGFCVDVKPVQENPSLDGYQAVVIGSAIHGAKWLPAALDFVQAHQEALRAVPVALFCVQLGNLGDDETSRRNRRAQLDAVRPLIQPAQPVAEGFFGGRMDRRSVRAFLPGALAWLFPTFDVRDESKVRAWAAELAPVLAEVCA